MTLDELDQLKHRVLSEHCMDHDKQSVRITVGMGTCGIKAGAEKVLRTLQNILGESQKVRITHVGCIGLCTQEPLVEVAMPGQPVATYCNVTPEIAKRIAREHIVGGQPMAGQAVFF